MYPKISKELARRLAQRFPLQPRLVRNWQLRACKHCDHYFVRDFQGRTCEKQRQCLGQVPASKIGLFSSMYDKLSNYPPSSFLTIATSNSYFDKNTHFRVFKTLTLMRRPSSMFLDYNIPMPKLNMARTASVVLLLSSLLAPWHGADAGRCGSFVARSAGYHSQGASRQGWCHHGQWLQLRRALRGGGDEMRDDAGTALDAWEVSYNACHANLTRSPDTCPGHSLLIFLLSVCRWSPVLMNSVTT